MYILKDKAPQNVEQLVEMTKELTSVSQERIIEHILELQTHGKITLREPSKPVQQKLSLYLKTKKSYWYWATIVLSITTTLAIFTVPEDAYPLVYIRYVLAAIFLSWCPGYSFTRALFPANSSTKKKPPSPSSAERYALSIGLSLVLIAIVGILLNYTPWGIRLAPVGLSLFFLTVVFATVGTIREYEITTRK